MSRKYTFYILIFLFMVQYAHGDSYYIDPINGSDTNNGSLASPWRSFSNIISYYAPEFRPPDYVDLQQGDVVYLMDGVHDTLLNPGGDNGPTDGGSYVVYFRFKHGDPSNRFSIKALPGALPVIDATNNGLAVQVLQSSYWTLSGITIINSKERGLLLDEISDVKVHNIQIYDTDGVDNNNIAGLYCRGCNNIEVYNSTFSDNYDRIAADTGGNSTENSSNVVFFGGSNVSFYNNTVFNSVSINADLSGGCLKYKHASNDPQSTFNVYNNSFRNCKHFSIASATPNTHVHHNIIENSHRIINQDLGGPTHQVNQLYEFNTSYNSGGIELNPTINWRNKEFPNDPQSVTIRNNIFYETIPAYNQENGLINVGTYMSDDLFNEIFPELNLSENCYYNPNTEVQLNIGAQNGGSFGLLGDQYQLAGWQSIGFDLNSLEVDPLFIDAENSNFHLANGSECNNMGAYANTVDLIFTNGFE